MSIRDKIIQIIGINHPLDSQFHDSNGNNICEREADVILFLIRTEIAESRPKRKKRVSYKNSDSNLDRLYKNTKSIGHKEGLDEWTDALKQRGLWKEENV